MISSIGGELLSLLDYISTKDNFRENIRRIVLDFHADIIKKGYKIRSLNFKVCSRCKKKILVRVIFSKTKKRRRKRILTYNKEKKGLAEGIDFFYVDPREDSMVKILEIWSDGNLKENSSLAIMARDKLWDGDLCDECREEEKKKILEELFDESMNEILEKLPLVPFTFYRSNNKYHLELPLKTRHFKNKEEIEEMHDNIIDNIKAGLFEKLISSSQKAIDKDSVMRAIISYYNKDILLLKILNTIIHNNFVPMAKKVTSFKDLLYKFAFLDFEDIFTLEDDFKETNYVMNAERTVALVPVEFINSNDKLLQVFRKSLSNAIEINIRKSVNDKEHYTDGKFLWRSDLVDSLSKIIGIKKTFLRAENGVLIIKSKYAYVFIAPVML